MLVDAATYVDGKRIPTYSPHAGQGFSWVGLLDPTIAEIQEYQKVFSLHSLAVEDAVLGRQRPKLDQYQNHSFLLLKTAMYNLETSRVDMGDIGVFVGSDFIVIVRHSIVALAFLCSF